MKTPIPYASDLRSPIDDYDPSRLRRFMAAVVSVTVAVSIAVLMLIAHDCVLVLLGMITLAPYMLGGFAGALILGRDAQLDTRLRATFLGLTLPLLALPLVLVAHPHWASLFVIGYAGFMLAIFAGYGSFFGSLVAHRLLHRAPPPDLLRSARAKRWLHGSRSRT